MKAILGTKIGMTQIFDTDGNAHAATVVAAGPCVVTQVKTKDTDGYNAVQLGFGQGKRVAKPQEGHMKASGLLSRVLREVRVNDIQPAKNQEAEVETELAELNMKVGDKITVENFEAGEEIQVTGVSKGKGFAGVIKRHNFNTGRKTHGSHAYRGHGSIGSGYPEHVFKGVRMAGRMGGEQVTVRGLKILAVNAEQNLLVVAGAVPGPRRGTVFIRGTV